MTPIIDPAPEWPFERIPFSTLGFSCRKSQLLVVCKLSILFGTTWTTPGRSAQTHRTKRVNRKYWLIKQI